jgi:hypothetical protein
MEDNDEDNDGIDELYDYVEKKSRGSCKVDQIKGRPTRFNSFS